MQCYVLYYTAALMRSVTHVIQGDPHLIRTYCVFQCELWSHFTAILRKSTRNVQACCEVCLIGRVLGSIHEKNDMLAGNCPLASCSRFICSFCVPLTFCAT